MAVIDHDAELARAGANVHGWFGGLLFFVRRYPLGAIGAVIMATFVATAIFADAITAFDPLHDQRATIAGAARGRARRLAPISWAATCLHGSSMARASRSPSPSEPPVLGCVIGVTIGLAVWIFWWLDRPARSTPDGHHAGPPAARDGAGDGCVTWAVAAQHHPRHRDPAGA